MTRLLAAALLLLVPAGFSAAEEPRQSPPLAVVELFTSQGCTSCPPADALLADLAQAGDVVALAYHVDYWDLSRLAGYAGHRGQHGPTV